MKKMNFTKNFNRLIALMASFVLFGFGLNAQCPAGQTNVDVTYTAGGYNTENGWLLYDATTMTVLACDGLNPVAGTTSVCATDGNTIELHTFESFGDGWCPPANIVVGTNETGAANGCNAQNFVIFDGNATASGNGVGFACPAIGVPGTAVPLGGGAIDATFTAACLMCEITCPADVVVDSDLGLCAAQVTLPDATQMNCAGLAMDSAPFVSFPNVNPVGAVTMVFGGAIAPPNPADPVTLELCAQGDIDFCSATSTFSEHYQWTDGAGTFLGNIAGIVAPPTTCTGIGGAGYDGPAQCSAVPFCQTYTMTGAEWLALGNTVNFQALTGGINGNLAPCNGTAATQDGISGTVTWPAAPSVAHDYADADNVVGPNASGPFPVGCTTVTFTTFTDTGAPVTCETKVTVNDAEAPVISCPADLEFNLLPGECDIIVTWDVTSNDNCDGMQSFNASQAAGPTTVAGPFCDPCADPSGGSALACNVGPNHIMQLISGVNAGDTLTDICFNQETFGGAVTITLNVYSYAGGPIPFDDGAGTFVPFATTTYVTQFGDNGACVCVPMPANLLVPNGTTQLAVEIIAPLNVRAVQTPANCNGAAATGLNTWLVAPACGIGVGAPATFSSVGFTLDASYAAIVLPFAPITIDDSVVGCNEFVTGDAVSTGTHCFAYKATDTGGNMDFCQFNITVNEFPGATTTLAANDNVQVSLNPDGGCTTVTADMVLEGGPYGCYDNFYMSRTPAYQGDNTGCTFVPGTTAGDCTGAPLGGQFGFVPVDCSDIGKTITVTIVDTATCSMAWATLTVEDKVNPVIECPDYDVDCTESIDPVTVVPPPAPGNTVSAAISPGITLPAFSPTLVQTDFEIEIAENCTDITNIQLFMDIQSTDLDDYAWDLISPAGTTVRFLPGPAFGNPTCNLGGLRNLTTIFDDSGAPIGCPAQPITAPLPGPFANFIGEASAGIWTVRMTPIFTSDDLTILDLELFVTGTCGAAATVVWSDNSDACGLAELTFADDATGGSCSTGTSGSIVRTWTATDIVGNTTKCTQNITINRPDLNDVEFPAEIITLDCSSPYPDTFAAVCVKDTTDFAVTDLVQAISAAGDTTFYNGGPLADGTTLLAFDIDNDAPDNRILKDMNVNVMLNHLNVFEHKLWLARLDMNGNVIAQVKLFDPNPNLNYIKCSVNNLRDMMFTYDDESCPMPHEACVNFAPTLKGQYQPMESINAAYAGLPVNAHPNLDWAIIYSDTLVPPVSTNLGTIADFSIEYLYTDDALVTTPTVSGGPFRSGDICGLTATYTDEVVDVCPTSYKIIRSWTVIDWCGTDPATRTARFEQLIKVIDTCPPVLDNKRTRLNDNDTWDVPVYTPSTAAGAHTVCMGNATLPPVDVCYENCSGVASYSTKLFTADGTTLLGAVPTNGGTFSDLTLDLADVHDDGSPDDKNAASLTFPILATPNPFDSVTIPGISTLNEPDAIYLARYEVTDACGNTSSLDCFIRLIDKIPPVPVCREETQLALTGFNGDTTTLCADDLDEGSYDNCGNVCFFIRKMVDDDDTDPIGNVDFGLGPDPSLTFEILGRDGQGGFDLARDFVYKNCTSFTCDDIGEDNQVFLLVVDDFVVNFVNDYLDNLFPFIDAVVDYNQVPLTILPYDKVDDEQDIFDVSDPTNIRIEADNDRHNRGKRFFEFYLNEDPNADGLFIVPTAIIWDGHFNFCMVNVHVEDKVRPTCTAPEDVWANCTDLPDNIDFTDIDELTTLFGTAVADDNCGATIEELNPNVQLDLCGVGQIIRSFRAEDAFGNRSIGTCRQTIMIMPVNSYKLNVPGDYEEECVNSGPQDFLYEEFACDLIAINSEDVELLASTDGECKKIIRTWSLINWCEYDGSSVATILPRLDLNFDGVPGDGNGGSNTPTRHNAMHMWVSNGDIMILNDNPANTLPSTGRYTYEQHIKIFDNTAPEVDYDGDVKFCGGDLDEDPCTAEVEITPDVMDFCTNTTGRWELDAFSTRFFDADFSGNGGSLTGRWPLGVHTVRFYFEDECGNISQFDVTFEAVDCKAPTPVCHNGLSIDVMPLSGMVELWAVDFDASSFDYCSPFELRINKIEDTNGDGVITNDDYVNTLPADDFIILDCDDVNAGLTMVQLWVAEQDGTGDDSCADNQDNDYCVTFVEVQDNNGVCGGPKVALGGKITNEENESVENVTIDLNVQGMNTITTSNDGEYLFPSLPAGGDYSVTPMRNDDVDNGVSTYDLVLISKHVLNVDLLDSPYKVVAADANKSGNISTLDLVAIRKVILRVENQFPNNTSWRFVDKAYAFSTIPGAAGENFREVVNYNNLASDELAADFIAVKIGDVSGDAIANSILGVDDRTFNGTLNLNADEATAVAGEEFTVEFTADKNVLGYQFTLDYNEKAVELVDIVDGLASEAQNFNVTNGMIATSWNNDVATSNEVMFSLVFRAKSDVNVMDIMTVSSELTKAEAYGVDGDLMNIALNFGNVTSENEFALYQNTPNPFESETNIGFTLPEASSATITISDVAGKIVKVVKGDFAKGYNTVSLKRSDIGVATGVLSYQLETPTNSATKQMIIIE